MKWNFGDNQLSCVVVSLIIAIPSLAYTFYLPALPGMAKTLGIPPSVAKLSMTFLMMTAMASLLVIGPLSDRYGRKPILITGLFINVVACLILSQTDSLQILLMGKGVQGIGLATCFAVAYPMIRDVLDGPAAMRMMAISAAIYIGATVLGPTLGAHVYDHFGWSMQFYIEAAYSLILIVLFVPFLPETLSPKNRKEHPTWIIQYIDLIKEPRNRQLLIQGATVNGAFAVYMTSSAFLYMHYFGLSTVMFGYLYGIKCFLQFIASVVTGKLVEHYPVESMMVFSYRSLIGCSIVLLACVYLWPESLLAWVIPMSVLLIANGIFSTSNRVAVVYLNADRAGVANSGQIFLHLMCDTLGSALVAMFYDSSQNVATLMAGVLLFSWIISSVLMPLFGRQKAVAK
ncbi:MFS transporter [Endozoicomonas arenosclerae]|uniref:MFS transporter n=1 Tax=Endozoicomonas arenosclerae TaxID=1633495 RepID=UPI0007843811|nr:MFS transporter [Endozoicomonas arenosclerae]